jgi:hypothetical protein
MALLVLLVGAGLIAAGLAARRNERRRRDAAAATVRLEVDAEGVVRELADGRVEGVHWAEIQEVEVLTTSVGVHREDGVVLVLAGDGERGCLVPSQLAVEHGVYERLHALPGFDTRRLVDAMEKPPPSRTTCWRRDEHYGRPDG